MKSFTEKVYEVVRSIPKGKVSTYGMVAKRAGNPQAARAVGMVMSKNQNPKDVPCHRVVGKDGALVGYGFGGVGEKRKKLLKEGVVFTGAKVDITISGF